MGHSSQPHWGLQSPEPYRQAEPNIVTEREKSPLPKYGDTKIEYNAFSQRDDIVEIDIPPTVKSIAAAAFICCKNLSKVTMHEGLEKIYAGAFSHCSSLSYIEIPDSVNELISPFENVPIKTLRLPKSLKSLSYDVFRDCKTLTEVSITSSKTSIADYTFTWSNITHIVFKEIPESIASRAFFNCHQIQSIIVPKGQADHLKIHLPKYLHKVCMER